MLNKYHKLSDADILSEYKKTKKLMDISGFNSKYARQKFQYDLCMLEAQIIKRKLNGNGNQAIAKTKGEKKCVQTPRILKTT